MRLRVRRSAEPPAAPHGSGADDRGRSSSSSPAGGVSVAKGIVALVLGREVDAELSASASPVGQATPHQSSSPACLR